MSKLSGILFKSLSARVMSSFAKRQWLICFFFTVVSVQFTHSQLFPVQVSPQLTPPYSLKLSDYSTSTTEKILVNLLLTDVNEADLQVRLRFSISGNSVNIQSKDFVQNAAPIQLTGGIPLRLSNLDLQPYFDLQNLDGITPSEYSKPLPDGLYQFCFEVFDWTTGRPLSEKKCYPVYLVLNDPPFLNLPQNGEQVPAQDPQNLIFQWTPRHVNATGVEYEFELRELWDTNVDPQTAFLASPNLYQTTGFANTLLYGPGETSLLEGKTYGWRVRAVVSDGISETAVFKNGGYSEIFYFTYTGKCDAPQYILAKSEGTTTEEITWQQNPDHINYQIQFRKEGGSNNVWFESETVETKKKLFFLEAETTYEYRVGGQCVQNGGYSYSAINTFTTPGKEDASEYNCGIPPEIVITNQDPLQLLGVNDVFTAGDFPVTVKEVNGGNGNYTGWGFIVVPYLGDTQIRVSFNNIQINTDKQLTTGLVETEYDEKFATTGGAGMSDVSELTELIEGDNDIDNINVNFVIPPDYFEDYITVEDGQVVITNPNDAQVRTSPLGDDKVIVDSAGNTYHVDAEGNVTKGGKIDEGGPVNADNVEGVTKNGEIESLTAKGITVTFNTKGTYGYDKLPTGINNTKLNEEYKTIKDAQGGNYEIVNHVAEKNTPSLITATVAISNSDYTIDDLIFKTKQGELLTHTKATNNTINLSVQGRYTFENEPIYAVVKSKQDTTKQQTAGAFNLWHLSRKTVDVVLVSVNGAQLPTAIELNTIFNQAATTLNIETKSVSLTNGLLGADNKLEIGDKPWLNTYNQEQKAIIGDLKQKIDYQKDKYYVFTFNSSFNTTKSIAGFMPLKRQFGFVFNGGLSSDEEGKEDLAKVTAHEIAHGIFALQHPFTTYGDDIKGKTPWLMDYANGDLLSHMDWAQIHNPNLKFYIFQDEEDGESVTSENLVTLNFEDVFFSNNIGIAPNGKTIKNIILHKPNEYKYVKMISSANPYLISGFKIYKKTELTNPIFVSKALFSKGKFQNYEGLNDYCVIEYEPENIEHSTVIYRTTGDGCSYYSAKINWISNENSSVNEVIQKIKSKTPKFNERHILKNASSSCSYTLRSLEISNNDKNTVCGNIEYLDKEFNAILSPLFDSTSIKIENAYEAINSACLTNLRRLSFEQIETLFSLLSNSEGSIWEEQEIAINRLASVISSDDYGRFFDLLEENNNEIIKNLIGKLQDKSLDPWDGDNYTNFLNTLLYMYQTNPLAWMNRIEIEDIESVGGYFAARYFTKPNIKIESLEELITGSSEIYSRTFMYNSSNGNISISEEAETIQAIAGNNEYAWYTVTGVKTLNQFETSPLSPIMIDFNEGELKVIEMALYNNGFSKNSIAIIPSIFLKFSYDKIRNDIIEKNIYLSLNGITIITGAPVIVSGASYAVRLYALAEVAGAIGDITVNSTELGTNNPNLKNATNIYNNIMAVIGVKNLLKNGIKAIPKKLPTQIKEALKKNNSIRALVLKAHLDWQAATRNLDGLLPTEKQIILKQGQVWRKLLNIGNSSSELLIKAKNTLRAAGIIDPKILSKLDDWKPSTLTKFDDLVKNPNYTGLLDEFKLNTDLFDKFKLVEETWWSKYSMAGISKRSGSTVPTQFKKYIGDIEVSPVGGGKLKLRDAKYETLDNLSPQYIGKLFDDAVTQNVNSSWVSGDFSNFPTNISNYLSDLKSKGYRLAIEPQVSTLGKNPKPDLLLFGNKKVGSITKKNVIYLEIKYLDDVEFTNSQKAITKNLPSTVVEKNGRAIVDKISGEEIIPAGQDFIINEAKKLTVDKSTLKMIFK
ncbi:MULTISPECIES: hypothetical protein [unclassified Cellulophaga]|uniref:hypothetical protein n=1 Tax=unclassified Cellulophaga TaxID=2634405 RepID=UPI0026E26BB9|nr:MULTISPECIES: hypothetical protein [unclassified Cellulophaga]MDO6490969.1 hypothetical protein [Cellulophaga sp. 2_MG-2023]MDO6493837.1 hypothetical protein [Cellulophaga sp. 3_MG-2023]